MNDRPVFAIRNLWLRAARHAVWTFVLAQAGAAMCADLAAWRWQQTLQLPQPGLIKIELSAETLDAARADQGDLRLFDPQGAEVPYVVDQSEPSASVWQRLEQMDVSVRDRVTVLEFTNSLGVPLESVMVETPVPSYLKSVTVDVAAANRNYATQSAGQFLFRQPSGAHRSTVKLKVNPGERVRLTLDDARSQPIPLTGLQLQGAALEEVAPREHPVTIARREEASDESRLLLDLGARHLQVATLKFTVTNPVFARTVSLISRVIEDGEIKEQLIARGTISRGNGPDGILDQTISVEARLPQRELWLAIRNEDSPPLKIDGVTAAVRPAYLIFQAAKAGSYTLHTGNAGVASPKYDITRLRPQLKSIPLSDLSL
ncbi:MAG TPA: hypothetical protein VLD18_08900, partial [Verrucomicrobiae bacterium]|nr:hypothetical protein [Verrucomicrobiae bacterium]